MDEYNLAEAFLDPTEVQRHVVDIGDFQKIPFAELAGLGGLIAELIPQFRTVTETINIPMEGLFRAINPKTGEVMPDLMYKSKQVAEAFVGSLKHANGEFDQAAFVKVPGVKEVTTSVAAINPATLMIAAGIMAMSKKLDNIQEGQKNIMGFLEKDKESKLKGDLTFLLDVFKKYRLNWSNSTFRNTQYNKTQDIEQEAEHNIDFYRSMLSGELKKKKFLVSKLDVKKNMQKLIENFSNYRLAIYIYAFASYLEIILLENFNADFLKSISEKIKDEGKLYTFDEKEHYEITGTRYSGATNGKNTYGSFTISGNVLSDGDEGGVPSYSVSGGNVALLYTYTDTLRDAPETKWRLIEDNSKAVADFKLDSNIKKGAIIVQTSKDGKTWINDVELTNVFAETQDKAEPIYTSKSVQLANGCYYRVIVVYETRIKLGEDKVLFVKTSDYDYKKTAEVYEFYLHDAKQSDKDENTQTKALGTLYRAEKENNGYAGGSSTLDLKDPHYGWSLGRFFVSGYTRATKDDAGTPVFLKTVGDQITLWFNLQQDIDKLHGTDALSIADDDKGYDKYFQIEKTDMGRGTLIIRYTDEKGVPHEPEIYTNYLEANATTSADTVVRLFEEGDYEVSLDYKIKSVPRKVVGIEVIPEYFDYHISFSFSVRNGNCMVYPFDVKTGQECQTAIKSRSMLMLTPLLTKTEK